MKQITTAEEAERVKRAVYNFIDEFMGRDDVRVMPFWKAASLLEKELTEKFLQLDFRLAVHDEMCGRIDFTITLKTTGKFQG